MSKKARIGFVGAGCMGQNAHLRSYVTWPDLCEVVALAEVRPELGRRVAARYGVPKVYDSAAAMLEAGGLDGLVVSQPFTRHGVLLAELAPAGIPIFTEKPIAGSIAVGEEILAIEAKHNAPHMVGYHKRSDPAVEWAKVEIDRLRQTGELGRLTYVRILMPAGDWVASGMIHGINTGESLPDDAAWDPAAPDMDEATNEKYISFVNYYIHQVNLMRHLLDEPYEVTYADPSGVMLAGQSETGAACTIEMSPYSTSVEWQEHALVCFEHGWLRVDLPAPLAANRPGTVTVCRSPEGGLAETVTPVLPWVDAMRQQAHNFIRFCQGEAPATCTAAEALEDLRVAREYMRILTGK